MVPRGWCVRLLSGDSVQGGSSTASWEGIDEGEGMGSIMMEI